MEAAMVVSSIGMSAIDFLQDADSDHDLITESQKKEIGEEVLNDILKKGQLTSYVAMPFMVNTFTWTKYPIKGKEENNIKFKIQVWNFIPSVGALEVAIENGYLSKEQINRIRPLFLAAFRDFTLSKAIANYKVARAFRIANAKNLQGKDKWLNDNFAKYIALQNAYINAARKEVSKLNYNFEDKLEEYSPDFLQEVAKTKNTFKGNFKLYSSSDNPYEICQNLGLLDETVWDEHYKMSDQYDKA